MLNYTCLRRCAAHQLVADVIMARTMTQRCRYVDLEEVSGTAVLTRKAASELRNCARARKAAS